MPNATDNPLRPQPAGPPTSLQSFGQAPASLVPLGLDVIYNPLFQFRALQWQMLPCYQILFITDGEGHHWVDGRQIALRKGDVLFLAPGQAQRFYKIRNLEGWALLFPADFVAPVPSDQHLLATTPLFDAAHSGRQLYFPPRDYVGIRFILQQITEEFQRPADWAQAEMLRKYLGLFLWFCERYCRQQMPRNSRTTYLEAHARLRSLLYTYAQTERQVEFYAEKMEFSTKSLNRVTYSVSGQNAKTYIDTWVTLEIKRQLLCTQASVRALSEHFHFDEPGNFIKYFKKMSGHTPSEFRHAAG
jgi:AraC family transcriptional regulator, transcriptional activator of pobA